MDKLFNSYWALRITALVLALLLFFYAKSQETIGQTSASNPQIDILTDVPLEAYYDKENLIVTGLPETVDVTIEGPMQIVLQTKLAKDFTVFVDLTSLLIGEHTVTVQSENFSEKLDVSIEPEVLDIVIEEKVTEEVKVEPELNSQMIAEGYELVGMSAEPISVLVTGAKSVIDSISYVKATINDEDEIKESFEKEATVKVLDHNLNKLDVLIEPATVDVAVEVRPYSREIPVVLRETGEPPDGLTIVGVIPQTKMVEVFGPRSIIDPITRIEVPFDLSKVEKSGTYEVKIPLPKGAFKLSTDTMKVEVEVRNTAETDNRTDEVEVQETQAETETESGRKPSSGSNTDSQPIVEEKNLEESTPREEVPVEEDIPGEEKGANQQ